MNKIYVLFALVLLGIQIQVSATGCNNLYVCISHDGQHLYFSSDRHNPGGNYEIYRSDLDGISNLTRLTTTSVSNFYPAESPDGTKIVWQKRDYGTSSEIWIMNADGTGQTQLTSNNVHDGYPNFSPDGQTIVFEAWDSSPYPEIFTMDLNGNNRTQITNESGAYWQSAPIYHPSGNYIYFSMAFNADNHIARMNLNGTNRIDITPPNSYGIGEGGLHFSPDGSHIIFNTSEYVGSNNGTDLVIADSMGGNWNKITNSTNGEYFYSAAWHPNNKIYYSYNPGSANWSIYEMSSSGSSSRQLSNCFNVGIENVTLPVFKVFPNPTDDVLHLEYGLNEVIEMYDATGRLLTKTTGNELYLSGFETGYYLLVLKSEEGLMKGQVRIFKYQQ